MTEDGAASIDIPLRMDIATYTTSEGQHCEVDPVVTVDPGRYRFTVEPQSFTPSGKLVVRLSVERLGDSEFPLGRA